METLIILIIAIGLAMDCFSLAIANSSLAGEIKAGIPLQTAIIFAAMHFLLLMAGYWLGGLLQNMFSGMESWAGFVVFVIIGIKMIREGKKRHPAAKVVDINDIRVVFVMAMAASMDAFLAGLALGILNGSAYLAAGLVAMAVFLFTFSGLISGDRFGMEFAKRTSIFGGVFMFVAAIHYLLDFLLAL